MKKAPRILVLNIHSHHNVGDAALTDMTVSLIRGQFPNSRITLVFNDADSYQGSEEVVDSFLPWIRPPGSRLAFRFLLALLVSILPVLTYRWFGKPMLWAAPPAFRKTFRAYCSADLVVCSPGGYFFSLGKGGDFLLLAYASFMAVLLKKPLFLFPQSFGPLHFRREKFLLRRLIQVSELTLVREAKSFEALLQWGVSEQEIRLFPDPAFAYPEASPETAAAFFLSHQVQPDAQPLVGITVLDWGMQNDRFNLQNRYEAALEDAITHLVQSHHAHIFFFPQCYGPTKAEDDRTTAERIANRLPHLKEHITLIHSPMSPAELKAIYGHMDLFVGTRMHSNIFALSKSVPTLAIGYLHKTEGIMQSAGMDEWVLNIHELSGEDLIHRLDALRENAPQIKAHLNGQIPRLLDLVSETGALFKRQAEKYL